MDFRRVRVGVAKGFRPTGQTRTQPEFSGISKGLIVGNLRLIPHSRYFCFPSSARHFVEHLTCCVRSAPWWRSSSPQNQITGPVRGTFYSCSPPPVHLPYHWSRYFHSGKTSLLFQYAMICASGESNTNGGVMFICNKRILESKPLFLSHVSLYLLPCHCKLWYLIFFPQRGSSRVHYIYHSWVFWFITVIKNSYNLWTKDGMFWALILPLMYKIDRRFDCLQIKLLTMLLI